MNIIFIVPTLRSKSIQIDSRVLFRRAFDSILHKPDRPTIKNPFRVIEFISSKR